MSIKLKVTDADRNQMGNYAVESTVLSTLLRERRFLMEQKGGQILESNGLSPELYSMSFNAAKDSWEAHLRPGALVVPTPGGNPIQVKNN